MNENKQRIAIAEACPSVCFFKADGLPYWRNLMEPCYDSDKFTHVEFDPIHDLNAMHEAEKVLTPEQTAQLAKHLQSITKPSFGTPYFRAVWWAAFIRAEPAQRAKAFLRTIGKWEDAP